MVNYACDFSRRNILNEQLLHKDDYDMKIYGDREAKVFSEDADNTFLDLHDSLDYIKAESKNCFKIDYNNS